MLDGVKIMPDELKVGTATAKRGELQKGIIKGVELNTTTSIDIPVLVMNGKRWTNPTHGFNSARN